MRVPWRIRRAPVRRRSAPRACIHCGSSLPAGARFCTKCELFQRRWLRSKSTIGYFTLLNAMLATIVVALNFALLVLPESTLFAISDPRTVGFSCFRDRAFVTLTNRGSRLATIEGGTVTEVGGESGVTQLKLLVNSSTSVIDKLASGTVELKFVEPGSGIPMSFDERQPAAGKAPSVCKYVFKINYQDFRDGKLRQLPPPEDCDCPDIESSEAPNTFAQGANGKAAPASSGDR